MPQDNTPADAATAKHNKGKNPNVAALVREWKVAIANHKANPQLVDYPVELEKKVRGEKCAKV